MTNAVTAAVDAPEQVVDADPLLTVEDVARRLNICRASVYSLIKSRQLASLKIGGCRRIAASAVDTLIAEATRA